eukprot:GFKZ01007927.1.p2 GENE.GFKZ01007927.1~~GFKZ01007927.1.p2  ORF type:complete len:113 (+),score=3.15 GFKZ01007927.1:77-415(+)
MSSMMLRGLLGIRALDDTALLLCVECNRHIDHLGDDAACEYKKGLGWTKGHNAMVRVLGPELFQAARVSVQWIPEDALLGRSIQGRNFVPLTSHSLDYQSRRHQRSLIRTLL